MKLDPVENVQVEESEGADPYDVVPSELSHSAPDEANLSSDISSKKGCHSG